MREETAHTRLIFGVESVKITQEGREKIHVQKIIYIQKILPLFTLTCPSLRVIGQFVDFFFELATQSSRVDLFPVL